MAKKSMIAKANKKQKFKAKKDIGYYDICDATGMLISYMYKKSSLYSKSEVDIEQSK